jgi:hypothetical protein
MFVPLALGYVSVAVHTVVLPPCAPPPRSGVFFDLSRPPSLPAPLLALFPYRCPPPLLFHIVSPSHSSLASYIFHLFYFFFYYYYDFHRFFLLLLLLLFVAVVVVVVFLSLSSLRVKDRSQGGRSF